MNALLIALGLATALQSPAGQQAGAQQTPKKKIVIAHRGASGYLPEHTLQGVAMAYQMGADFIEPDCVLSKDNVPVVVHDTHIDTISDVAKKFPDRKRKDGRYYAIDFTVAELKTLAVSERFDPASGKPVYPKRFPLGVPGFTIPTLAEEIELVQGLNKSTGRILESTRRSNIPNGIVRKGAISAKPSSKCCGNTVIRQRPINAFYSVLTLPKQRESGRSSAGRADLYS